MEYRPHKRPCVSSLDVHRSRKQDEKEKHNDLPQWKVRLGFFTSVFDDYVFPWFLFIGF